MGKNATDPADLHLEAAPDAPDTHPDAPEADADILARHLEDEGAAPPPPPPPRPQVGTYAEALAAGIDHPCLIAVRKSVEWETFDNRIAQLLERLRAGGARAHRSPASTALCQVWWADARELHRLLDQCDGNPPHYQGMRQPGGGINRLPLLMEMPGPGWFFAVSYGGSSLDGCSVAWGLHDEQGRRRDWGGGQLPPSFYNIPNSVEAKRDPEFARYKVQEKARQTRTDLAGAFRGLAVTAGELADAIACAGDPEGLPAAKLRATAAAIHRTFAELRGMVEPGYVAGGGPREETAERWLRYEE